MPRLGEGRKHVMVDYGGGNTGDGIGVSNTGGGIGVRTVNARSSCIISNVVNFVNHSLPDYTWTTIPAPKRETRDKV